MDRKIRSTDFRETCATEVFTYKDLMALELVAPSSTDLGSSVSQHPSSLHPVAPNAGVVYPSLLHPGAVHHRAAQPGAYYSCTLHHGLLQPGAVQPGAVQPGAVQPGVVHPSLLHPSLLHPGIVQHRAVQPGAYYSSHTLYPSAPNPGAHYITGEQHLVANDSSFEEQNDQQTTGEHPTRARFRVLAQDTLAQHAVKYPSTALHILALRSKADARSSAYQAESYQALPLQTEEQQAESYQALPLQTEEQQAESYQALPLQAEEQQAESYQALPLQAEEQFSQPPQASLRFGADGGFSSHIAYTGASLASSDNEATGVIRPVAIKGSFPLTPDHTGRGSQQILSYSSLTSGSAFLAHTKQLITSPDQSRSLSSGVDQTQSRGICLPNTSAQRADSATRQNSPQASTQSDSLLKTKRPTESDEPLGERLLGSRTKISRN